MANKSATPTETPKREAGTNPPHLRTCIVFICAICVIRALSAQSVVQKPTADPTQKPAQFETRADVVLVDVTVVDRDGEPVNNLAASDFVLEVNGQPRPIHTVQFISSRGVQAGVPEPSRLRDTSSNDTKSTGRLLLFAIDESHLRIGGGRAVISTAQKLMDALAPGDLIGLSVLPDGGGVEFTNDRNRVRTALQRVTGKQPSRGMNTLRVSEAWAFESNNTQMWDQVLERECAGEGGFARQACETQQEAEAKATVAD